MINQTTKQDPAVVTGTPIITNMTVIPVAGRDSMLLNLSGAHGPYFTRNIVILEDSSGKTGVGEVPGGEKIRKTLEDSRALIIGQSIGAYNSILNRMRIAFAESGILTSMLHAIGINNVTFLTSAGSALVCTIIANIWRGTAQSMILSYSGLKTISRDIMEAADIDGASSWQRLIHVTLPSIMSVISINVILNIITGRSSRSPR